MAAQSSSVPGAVAEKQLSFPPVLSKRDFVLRYRMEEFGNRAPTWDNIREFLRSGYNQGLIHVRNRIAGGDTWYDVQPRHVPAVWEQALRMGYKPGDLYLSAMAPTEKTLIQGEVMQSATHGIELIYSQVRKPMRDALHTNSQRAVGIMAVSLLAYYMVPKSYDWLQILLERYEGHVVELSVYSTHWGTIPGNNSVFWEVRSY